MALELRDPRFVITGSSIRPDGYTWRFEVGTTSFPKVLFERLHTDEEAPSLDDIKAEIDWLLGLGRGDVEIFESDDA